MLLTGFGQTDSHHENLAHLINQNVKEQNQKGFEAPQAVGWIAIRTAPYVHYKTPTSGLNQIEPRAISYQTNPVAMEWEYKIQLEWKEKYITKVKVLPLSPQWYYLLCVNLYLKVLPLGVAGGRSPPGPGCCGVIPSLYSLQSNGNTITNQG